MGNVAKGAMVMLLFSIRKGNLPSAVEEAKVLPAAIKFAIYLNILGVVVLAELAELFSEEQSREVPEAFGVDAVIDLPEGQGSIDGNEGEKEEEQFL